MSETALAMVQTTPGAVAMRQGWGVIATHPQAEDWACANLRRMGYRTYLPLYAARVRDPILRTLSRIVHRPLFTSYAFVWLDGGQWRPIRNAYGVRILLMDGEIPAYALLSDVEGLQTGEMARLVPPPSEGDIMAPGAVVAVSRGVFQGRVGVLQQKAGMRGCVLLMMMGVLRKIDIALSDLAFATEDENPLG